jgi:hypothetical protein
LVTPSAAQDAVHVRNSSLAHQQNANFDAQQQKSDFAPLDAKLEDSLDKHVPGSMPQKLTSHISQTTYAEVSPDERPTDTGLEALEDIPVRTPVKRKKAWIGRRWRLPCR